MKTSLRLAFSAVCVAFITLAASGAPLPFFHASAPAPQTAPSPLSPPANDAALEQAPSVTGARPASLAPIISFSRQ